MIDLRRVLAAVGVLAALVGLGAMVLPPVAAAVPVGRSLVLAVGGVAALQALRVLRARRATDVSAVETGDPETEQDLAAPGEGFDELLARVRQPPPSGERYDRPGRNLRIRDAAQVRDRLEDAALDAVTRKWGCSRERARTALDRGEWTDDPMAAALFADAEAVESAVPLGDRFRTAISGETRYRRRAKRAALAIAALSDGDHRVGSDPAVDLDRDASADPGSGPGDDADPDSRSPWDGDADGAESGASGRASPAPAATPRGSARRAFESRRDRSEDPGGDARDGADDTGDRTTGSAGEDREREPEVSDG